MSNNSQIAFNAQGKTVVIAATTSAPTGLQVPVDALNTAQATGQYRIVNSGTVIVFLGFGPTAAIAAANAVAPVAGTPSSALALLPGAIEVLRFTPDAFFSGLAASATSVYITPGQGL
jgi:hypothetical protein